MSIGFAITKADLDTRGGQLAMAVREDLRLCAAMCDLLNDTSVFANDAALTALGYTSGEVTQYRASFTDLKALYSLSHGGALPGGPNDYFFNAKHLWGAV